MLKGKCRLLKIYISESSKYKSHNLTNALIAKFKEIGMAGVTVSRGIEGYGQSKAIHSMKVLDLSSSLPIIIELVDTCEKIEQAIEIAKEMVNEGLIITAEVDAIKNGKD
jgi:PII-like signaling protein